MKIEEKKMANKKRLPNCRECGQILSKKNVSGLCGKCYLDSIRRKGKAKSSNNDSVREQIVFKVIAMCYLHNLLPDSEKLLFWQARQSLIDYCQIYLDANIRNITISRKGNILEIELWYNDFVYPYSWPLDEITPQEYDLEESLTELGFQIRK